MEKPGRIASLLEAMEENYRQMWNVVAQSPARLVLHGAHFSSMMTPPPTFEQYFVPYFKRFNEAMHGAGKRVAFHGDADTSLLLDQILDCGFDVADTFATAPLVPCTLEQARNVWGDRITIWGGVPSIILEPEYPFEDFKAYMIDLHKKTAGRPGFIMDVSDNIMPNAEYERLVWIRDFLISDCGLLIAD